jgi:hypothetical protein
LFPFHSFSPTPAPWNETGSGTVIFTQVISNQQVTENHPSLSFWHPWNETGNQSLENP